PGAPCAAPRAGRGDGPCVCGSGASLPFDQVRRPWQDGDMALEIGAPVPDFTLRDQHGQDVTLSSYSGTHAVAVVFYPFAFSRVCTGELCAIRDDLPSF